ncbi:MAG: hypothetical protein R3C40_01985, partial [Parvularculaceae bacterium]
MMPIAGKTIFNIENPRLFSIDPGRPFLADLVAGILDEIGDDQITLAKSIVLLPTRRAARTFNKTILDELRARGRNASLLPKVQAIGDFGDGDIIVEQFALEDDFALPPPVSQTERLMTLARLVMERDRKYALEQNFAAALSAARELS